jgi:hypothetical protein
MMTTVWPRCDHGVDYAEERGGDHGSAR